MATKSIVKRVRITKNKKILRRALTLGHSRGNKNTTQMKRKKQFRGVADMHHKTIEKYF